MLCGDGFEHRKQWIEDRLELLADCFSVSVCGFSVIGTAGETARVIDGLAARDTPLISFPVLLRVYFSR